MLFPKISRRINSVGAKTKKLSPAVLKKRLQNIRMLVLDVDGIMTDCRIFMDGDNEWRRMFSIRDGYGLAQLKKAGFKTAVITGSKARDIQERVRHLKIDFFFEGNLEKFNEIDQMLIENRDKFSEDLAKNSIESTEKLLETYSKPTIDLVEAEKDEFRALKDLTELINSEAFKVLVLKEPILSEIILKVNELVDKQVEKKKMYDELKKIKSGQESSENLDASSQDKK